MRTGDQSYIKELNKSIALQLLRSTPTISRTQIAKISGLNKATISSIVDELLEQNLVFEVGRGPSSMGRRPVLLQFNAEAGYAIGLEIAVHSLRAVVTNLAGKVLNTVHRPLNDHDVTSILHEIKKIVTEISAHIAPSPLGLLGVGVGVPGLVNFSRGIVLNAPNLSWRDVPLQNQLEEILSLPVWIDNEANAGALGEKRFGIGENASNMIYISAATGVGAGIIMQGDLVRGEDGLSGEFGHMTIESQGPLCSCGNRGCLEIFSSERTLLHEFRQVHEGATFDDILQALDNGDLYALRCIQKVGHYLGIGIANMINAINPSIVVIGNRLAQAGTYLLDAVNESLSTRCFIKPYSGVTVQLSTLGIDACAMGAASIVVNHYFAGPDAS